MGAASVWGHGEARTLGWTGAWASAARRLRGAGAGGLAAADAGIVVGQAGADRQPGSGAG